MSAKSRMSEMSPPPANRWDKTMLAEMRRVGDPEADRAVATVIDGQGIERVNAMRMAT